MSDSVQPETQRLLDAAASQGLERHTIRSGFIRDAIIGLADGLTVPFAVTASLSSIGSTKLVILGGLAELLAGSISMGLGAYLATVTDARHFQVEEAREQRQVTGTPHLEGEILMDLFTQYGISREEISPILQSFRQNPESWVKFMMDFEVKLERPSRSRPWISAFTMGMAYFVGGLIPMFPYFVVGHISTALVASVGITAVMLSIFGYIKSVATGIGRFSALYGSLETLLIGAVAAGASYSIVRSVNDWFEMGK
ncbi:Ccc1 family [Thelonectria olida]|uniref:Ccc1 family n=1 Tax=Thelonectria olida TaxID=1576542 RepID=A0A9P8VM07_9HYPO|nr:Ccc1 family [Thelonectria olida]